MYFLNKVNLLSFQFFFIQKIELPASLESIGEYAFNNCQNLQEVTIPNKEIKIENRAFYNCPKLNTVTIPAKVKEIRRQKSGRPFGGQPGDS